RDGIRLVGVVFGGKTASRRDRHMQSLLNKSWSRARAASTYAAKPIPKPTLAVSGSVATALVNSPVPPLVVRRPASNWGIQIGAFAGYTDAHTAAGNAARRLTNLPQTASLKIQPVDETADTLYRARLMGMDEDYARASCHQLVRNGQPCALVTPQGNEMASLSSQ
ncbi:MAG: SPOR domain-containing protein, partial [Alphaproteobacteria bacterium]|nr:SPOR domain-containing protein [Alphaproteobacteria bacterium]